MYNNDELPRRRRIEPDEFADLLVSGEMRMITEEQLKHFPKHRIYRYSPKDIFVYTPKVSLKVYFRVNCKKNFRKYPETIKIYKKCLLNGSSHEFYDFKFGELS